MNQFFNLTTIICLLLLTACTLTDVPVTELVDRQGLKYRVNSETPFTGSSVDYYDNGQVEFKINYKDGKQDGLLESYYKNGQLESKVSYKDGRQDGLSESYDEHGQLEEKLCFKSNKTIDMSYCER